MRCTNPRRRLRPRYPWSFEEKIAAEKCASRERQAIADDDSRLGSHDTKRSTMGIAQNCAQSLTVCSVLTATDMDPSMKTPNKLRRHQQNTTRLSPTLCASIGGIHSYGIVTVTIWYVESSPSADTCSRTSLTHRCRGNISKVEPTSSKEENSMGKEQEGWVG